MRGLTLLVVALLLPATALASVSTPEAATVPAATRDVGAVGLRRSGFSELAERDGFAVAHARVHGLLGKLRHWNSGHCCGFARSLGIDDVGCLEAVIEGAKRRVPIDASRVYMAGHSNGGMLTDRFAAEQTPLLVARAVSAATIGGRPAAGESEWLPPRPVDTIPIVHVHGRADPIVLYDGGEDERRAGRTWISARDSVRFWAEHNGCEGAAAERRSARLGAGRRPPRSGRIQREERPLLRPPRPRVLSPSNRQRLIRSAARSDGAGLGSMGLTIRQRARPLRVNRGTGQRSICGRRAIAAVVEELRWKKW